MRRRMHLHNIRSVIEQALLLSVQEIQFAGIADAALKKVSVSSEQLQHLASELVGPYSDRIATFLGYPLGLVQLMAARLQGAKIWQDDHVHGESWFDPEKGAIAFMLDLMVAEGQLVRRWSEEKKQYSYHAS